MGCCSKRPWLQNGQSPQSLRDVSEKKCLRHITEKQCSPTLTSSSECGGVRVGVSHHSHCHTFLQHAFHFMDLNTSVIRVMCEGAMEEARRKIGRQLAFICFICLSLGKKNFLSLFLKITIMKMLKPK